MRLSSRNYREYLHTSRTHPPSRSQPLIKNQNQFFSVSYFFTGNLKPLIYTTVPAFLGLELWMELQVNSFPAGLSFPFGFILFWAFFYSFRTPLKTRSPQVSQAKSNAKKSSTSPPFQAPPKQTPEAARVSPVPPDIQAALLVLGLKDCRDWGAIHKRYRELAKQVHPDLNPDLTSAENRFILYDNAYRKLMGVKNRYFKAAS